MTSKSQNLVDLIGRSALPSKDYTSILRAIGTAKVVLIGEASHGTHEFYKERCEITKKLIIEKGVTFIAAEADWPDAFEINKFVRGKGAPTLEQAFSRFERFPRWMWRNKVMIDFVKWLKEWNDKQTDQTTKVGFYGLDLYSFYESAQSVLHYLKEKDPAAYSRARERYAFFDRYKSDAQAYGYATNFGFDKAREFEVTRELSEMNKKSATQQESLREGEDLFAAEINAKVVKNAEEYYRCMFSGNTWNMRDSHMVETLKEIMDFIETSKQEVGGSVAKAVVWAHNSHLGDASATDAAKNKEVNIGQLVREKWGKEDTFNIGFTTYTGTVSAADEWDGDVKAMNVNQGMAGSYEELFHSVGKEEFLLLFRSNVTGIKIDKELVNELGKNRMERAIGVIYKPDTERYSHYFNCKLSQQFDCVIHIDTTSALEPLDATSVVNVNEPETYPMGL
jgi:erythromycin esterase-like protein